MSISLLAEHWLCGEPTFFREIGIPVVPGQGRPDPAAPDPPDFARRAAQYGIESNHFPHRAAVALSREPG
jgi:hypothetical protein